MTDLRDFLTRHEMTAADLARAIDYTPDAVRRMARGECATPRAVMLAAKQVAAERLLGATAHTVRPH